VTSTLPLADAALIALVLGIWIWTALRATSVPYAATARDLSRRAGRTLALISVGLFLIVARVCLVAALASASWWFAQEKVGLSLPLLLAAAAATAVASVPRLLAIRTAARAFNGVNAMPPALRHEAAHPLLAWPVQLTAYAAAAGEVVFFLVSYPATAGSSLAVMTGVALAGVVVWWRLARRHARFAGQVMVPRRRVRLLRTAGAFAGLGLSTVAAAVLALIVTAPPAMADAGHPPRADQVGWTRGVGSERTGG
jgi:hypothetical protein